MNRFFLILTFLFSQLIVGAAAQTIDTQEADAKYDSLIYKEDIFTLKVDSMSLQLQSLRTKFDQSGNDDIALKIINLENDIYNVRSELSLLGTQIVAIENNYAKSQRAEQSSSKTKTTNIINLIEHPQIKNNISAKDLLVFNTTTKSNQQLTAIRNSVDDLYEELKELKIQFDKTITQEQVNSAIEKSFKIKEEIATENQIFQQTWGKLYNIKLDNYIVIVDKLGLATRSQLENIDMLGRQTVQAQMVDNQNLAPALEQYSAQMKLQIGYEILLAEMLNIDHVVDSLNKTLLKITEPKKMPDVIFPYRNTLVYGDITIGNHYDYKTLNDIPLLKTPSAGLYYAVQVALVSGAASSIKIFKNALPIQQEKVGSKMRYVLGGFRTYAETANAVKECYKFGYRAPKAVAWLNGKFVSISVAKAYEEKNPVEQMADGYKIVIVSETGDIVTDLKFVIDIHAPGKTISRVSDPKGFMFTLMQFSNPDEARVIAQIIKTKHNDLISVDVIDIEQK